MRIVADIFDTIHTRNEAGGTCYTSIRLQVLTASGETIYIHIVIGLGITGSVHFEHLTLIVATSIVTTDVEFLIFEFYLKVILATLG
jgi:hypothetical protein